MTLQMVWVLENSPSRTIAPVLFQKFFLIRKVYLKPNTTSVFGIFFFHITKILKSFLTMWGYGITGYGGSRPGIQIQKDFCIKINIPKKNYWILRIGTMGSLSSLQKSEFLKLIILFFHYFWCQNWDQWHKMSGKITHIIY